LDQGVLRKANNRRYLFDTIAKVMRQILVDYARARSAHKRGRDWQRKSLEAVVAYFEERHLDMCELDRALKELAAVHERQSKVVTLRVFADLAWQDLAEQLHVSVSTAKGDFRLARAWLHERLGGEIDDS
jgi:RNA polymerase sigma factor (TIGR02999 family)